MIKSTNLQGRVKGSHLWATSPTVNNERQERHRARAILGALELKGVLTH